MCSLHLTHPSGAVGSRHCGARGAVGGSVPCPRVSPQSWTLPARAGIRTHNLGLPLVSSPTLYPLGLPQIPHSGNHGYIRNLRRSPSWELRTASPRGRYGERYTHASMLRRAQANLCKRRALSQLHQAKGVVPGTVEGCQ